ncbi:MAG: hypothetical protein ACI8WT_000669 [Clostridium sp.]|jgi:hypothetical protein
METTKKCPICGCSDIREGKLSGYVTMRRTDKFYYDGSGIVSDICTKCGHILSSKVTNP